MCVVKWNLRGVEMVGGKAGKNKPGFPLQTQSRGDGLMFPLMGGRVTAALVFKKGENRFMQRWYPETSHKWY